MAEPEVAALVRRFYADLWNAGDEAAAPGILHPDLDFRGSLNAPARGIDGFLSYFRGVRVSLRDFRCEIRSLVAEGDRAAARMLFSGWHESPLLGVAPTGRLVEWDGAAFFTARDGRLAEIWVLGDVDGLKARLAGA